MGNGSDEVLAHCFQALLKHDQPLLFPDITYSFYPVYCNLYQIEYQTIPLRQDFSIAVEDFRRPNGGIIFPNPNAPTGRLLPLEAVEQLLQANRESVVVVDEAYPARWRGCGWGLLLATRIWWKRWSGSRTVSIPIPLTAWPRPARWRPWKMKTISRKPATG